MKNRSSYTLKLSVLIRIYLLLVLLSGSSLAQVMVTGTLTDTDNNPISGANIYLDGTVLGTASDNSGSFIIRNVPQGEYTLIISFIGYQQVS